MSTPNSVPLTAFQQAELRLDSPDNVGPDRERLLYRSKEFGVTALVALRGTLLPHEVVIYPHRVARPGHNAHLAELTPTDRAMVSHVVHAIGGKMLAFSMEGQVLELGPDGIERVVERVDGFSVPRQGHVRLGLRFRREPEFRPPSPQELDHTQALFQLNEPETEELDARLAVQDLVRPIIDNPLAPDSIERLERIKAALMPAPPPEFRHFL